MTIAEKYDKRAKEIDSLVCVGLDADFAKIPKHFLDMEFPQFEFNKWIIEETHELVSAYKPNSAFYEARGDVGIRELKMTVDYLAENHPSILTILDAKRGDIGNTNNGYVESIFDWLGFDAVTIYPYLGQEAVQPFLDRADKAVIILCRTSNEGAKDFQDLKVCEDMESQISAPYALSTGDPLGAQKFTTPYPLGKSLWQVIAEKVFKEWNKNKNCMLVVGATYPEEMKKIREVVGDMIFLVPGVGAQGGSVKSVMESGVDSNGRGLIINSSRGIIFSENPKEEARKLRDEIRKYKNK
jgi:orotidine 5'-phosphate decarboxylase subfamily 2